MTGYMAEILSEPHLEMAFGCKPFTPQTTCQDIHHGPIRKGSKMCCAACHTSGCDHFDCMRRDPKTDPKPEKPGKARRTIHRAGSLKGGTGA